MLTKAELRIALRKQRQLSQNNGFFWKSCPCEVRNEFTRRLAPGMTVAGYAAMGSEVDPAPLLDLAAERGCSLALPFLANREAMMEFRRWHPEGALERADFGFFQPAAGTLPASPDLIIVPLLGFDRAMHRLGQGAGHYDRAFPNYPNALKIGLAWTSQQVDALPVDPWDIPLDAILTEREWISA